VAGSLATASLQLVNRAFQQLTKSQQPLDEAATVVQQAEKNSALAASLVEARRQNNLLSLCCNIIQHKDGEAVKQKNEDGQTFC
jgi:hypothetical protein